MTGLDAIILVLIILLALAIGSLGRRIESIEAALVECASDIEEGNYGE